MLRFMRKYASGWLVKGLFGAIILVFIFWGVGSFRAGDKTVAEVGEYKVSHMEYQDTYKKLQNMYRTLLKDKFDEAAMKELNLREKVMNQLVDRYLLVSAAGEMGIGVSDAEFIQHLNSIDAFRRDGRFSQKAYLELLKQNGMDPKQFEEGERISIMTSRVVAIIRDNALSFNDADFYSSYVKERGQVNLAYGEFNPSDFKDKVSVDEKDLESAYGKQKGFEVIDSGALKEREIPGKLKGLKAEEWLRGLKKGDISLPVRTEAKSYIFQLLDLEEGKPIDKATVVKDIKEKMLMAKAKTFAKARAEEAVAQKSVSFKAETGFVPRMSQGLPKIGAIPKDDLGLLALSGTRTTYEKPVEIDGRFYVFSFKGEKVPDQGEWEKEKEGYRRYLASRKQEEAVRSFMDEMKKRTKVTIHWNEV